MSQGFSVQPGATLGRTTARFPNRRESEWAAAGQPSEWGKAGHKPGSVATAPPGAGPVGQWRWIISLEPPLPATSSGTHRTERDNWPTLVPRAEALALLPAGVYRAGTSRCRWCALTAPLHPCLCPGGPSAVCFCGTLLTVSRTGRYPAGLAIGEPGLSSTRSTPLGSALSGNGADRDHLTCFLKSSLRLARLPGRAEGLQGRGSTLGPASALRRKVAIKVAERQGVVAQPDRATVS
jgi:hypothetical protein